MDRKFYPDSFEKILKDQADDFKMYPSGKNWHGIYNNLHPGRKWPSLAMGIMLTGALLIVGRLNTESTRGVSEVATVAKKGDKSASEKTLTANRADNNIIQQPTIAKPNASNVQNTVALTEQLTSQDESPESSVSVTDAVAPKTNSLQATLNTKRTDKNNQQPEVDQPLLLNNELSVSQITNDITDNLNFDVATGIYSADADHTSPSANKKLSGIKFPVSINAKELTDSSKINQLIALANSGKTKSSRFSLKFNVSPTLGYRNFAHEREDPMAPNFALASSANVSVPENAIDHRIAIGFQLGASLLYDVSKKAKLRAGLQFNYTGYNIHAYSVHPISSNIILYNENDQSYYANGLSSFSSTPGPSPVNLHNQQLQLSFPIGLQMELAQRGNVRLNAAATFQPTYLLVGTAYVASANRKNYLSESSLLRKWNMSTAFETFVSFKTSNSLTMHVGPQFRYQLLSSYSNKYPHQEHLFDFGINFGVSKSLK